MEDAMKEMPLEGGVPRKVTARHLERWALVYVRQSSPQQLVRHQESTRLQYALQERARSLGWEPHRISVIDDDLGRSASSVVGRPGFQRMVAEVGLNHVGIIVGMDMSRFARSCKDWHQLLETCGLFGTLIADMDGIYDPADYNDRRLLGLKGTMSEAELHMLKRRMYDGKLAKARRGELAKPLPIGYFRKPSGEVIKDPDEQARTVVETAFRQFEVKGTAFGVLCYLNEHGLKLPVREPTGSQKGELDWRRPSRNTLGNILKNPIYAGAYVLGLRPTDRRKLKPGRPGTGRTVAAVGKWEVFLPNRMPAYISWDQYMLNQEQLKANCPQEMGVPRNGSALVAGLLRCGRCGHRMRATYVGSRLHYLCAQEQATWDGPRCQSLVGRVVDQEVERQALVTLQPAALEVSMTVAADFQAERDKEETLWRQRMERAQFEADRARRQYNAVEPENRLVVRTLEKDWEEKLQAQREIEEDYRRYRAQTPAVLTEPERANIRTIAQDIPGLWNAPTTTQADRKEIIRQLIDQVTVWVLGESERVRLNIRWAGGYETSTEITRPVASLEQLSYLDSLLDRVQALREAGRNNPEIAKVLNEEGWRPAKRRETFNGEMVGHLFEHMRGTPPESKRPTKKPDLGPDEWTVADLAAAIPMPAPTLHLWAHRQWVSGRLLEGPPKRWVLWADEAELKRLRAFRARERGRRPLLDPGKDIGEN